MAKKQPDILFVVVAQGWELEAKAIAVFEAREDAEDYAIACTQETERLIREFIDNGIRESTYMVNEKGQSVPRGDSDAIRVAFFSKHRFHPGFDGGGYSYAVDTAIVNPES